MFRYAIPVLALTVVTACGTTSTDVPTGPEGPTEAVSSGTDPFQIGPASPLDGPPSTSNAHASQEGQGLTRKTLPHEDPGPPFYARITHMLDQFFHDDG